MLLTYPYGKVISTIPVSAIPRGIAVDDKNNKFYIAIMGGASLNILITIPGRVKAL